MAELWSNNAATTLGSDISAGATVLSVAPGDGAKFPAISNPDFCYATLDDGTNIEIVQVVGRATDTLSIVRAQQGTSARAWVATNKVELRLTKATLENFASVENALSNAISVVSQALSNEISNRISAANALSQAISVLSQAHSVVSQALSNETSNRVSADNALSQAISVVSQQISVLSQAHSVLSQTVSVMSQRFSTLRGGTTGQVLKKVDATDFNWTWSADATGGGSSAGITSNAISVLSQGISVVSNALSNEISNRVSLANAVSIISQQVSVLSQAHSVLSQAHSVLSSLVSNLTSAHNALSNIVSDSLSAGDVASNTLSNLLSAHSVISQTVSVMSQRFSTLKGGTTGQVLKKIDATDFNWTWSADATGGASSAGVTSNAISVLSQGISVVSNALSNEISNRVSLANAVSVISQQVSVLSQAHSVLSQTVSVMSQRFSTLRGGTTGQVLKKVDATDFNWTWSADATGGASSAGVTSNAISVLSQGISVVSNALSNEISNRVSLANAVSIISQQVSALSQAQSVLSQSLSNEISNRTSADNVLSQAISVISQQVSVLSQTVSVMSQRFSTLRGGTTGQVLKKVDATDFNWTWSTDATGGAASGTVTSNNLSILSQGISVVSNALSNEISNRVSLANAVSIISQQVSVLSQQVSVLSQAHSVLSQTVSVLSATGAIAVLQNVDTSAVSAGAPIYAFTSASTFKRANASAVATKAVLGLVLETAIAVSATGRVQTAGLVTLTTGQWDSVTGQSGGLTPGTVYYLDVVAGLLKTTAPTTGAVRVVGVALSTTVMQLQIGTADDVASALSTLSQAISVVSNALSNEISNRISADNALSQAISVLSQQLSVLSQAHSALSQTVSILSNAASNALSVANAASNAASIVSTAASNALSVANAASNAASVVSNALSNETSNRLSADNVLSQAISVISQQVSVLSQTVSVMSQRFSTLRGGTTGQVLKKIDATDFNWTWSADNSGGAGSATVTSQNISVISQNLSVLSQGVSVLSQTLSVLSSQVSNLTSAHNALSNVVSNALSAGDVASNAISNALSVANAASNAVSNEISNRISADNVLSQAISVISDQVSVISAGLGLPQVKVVGNIQTISATALTNISGMSVSVVAGGTYKVQAVIMHTHSAGATTAIFGFGLTFPAMVGGAPGAVGRFDGFPSAVVGSAVNLVSTNSFGVIHNGSASGSILVSAANQTSGAVIATWYDGLFIVSTSGTIQFQAKASATTAAVHIQRGSYVQAFRIS